jgi:hypothetical protein
MSSFFNLVSPPLQYHGQNKLNFQDLFWYQGTNVFSCLRALTFSGISLIWQSKLSSPRAADNGIPWIFPDGEV